MRVTLENDDMSLAELDYVIQRDFSIHDPDGAFWRTNKLAQLHARRAARDLRLDMAEALAERDADIEELSRIVHAALNKVQRVVALAPEELAKLRKEPAGSSFIVEPEPRLYEALRKPGKARGNLATGVLGSIHGATIVQTAADPLPPEDYFTAGDEPNARPATNRVGAIADEERIVPRYMEVDSTSAARGSTREQANADLIVDGNGQVLKSRDGLLSKEADAAAWIDHWERIEGREPDLPYDLLRETFMAGANHGRQETWRVARDICRGEEFDPKTTNL